MDFELPEIGEGLYEAELVRWLVKPGDAVRPGQGLLEVMTDKATMEVPAPFAGTVTRVNGQPGDTVKVGQAVLSYTPAGQSAAVGAVATDGVAIAPPAKTPAAAAASVRKGRNGQGGAPDAGKAPLPAAAPSVRHLARKLGIDLAAVRGSGPAGRILLEDLTQVIQARPAPAGERPPEPQLDLGVAGTRVKLHGLRKRIAAHLVTSKRTAPHYSYVDECDLSEVVRLRQSLKEPLARRGVKLTYLAFLVKAAALALKEVPLVNASLDDAAGEIVLHDRYHVGVAVAAPAGLVVPVVRDADKKDVFAIAQQIERLSADARAGRVKREELVGSTFTVTSVGNIGGLISTPIINHPEVGILGVGKVVKRPVYDDHGRLRPAELVYLSFSFDHRVVDGAVGATFGNAVIRHLQNPAVMLLPG
jgi:pyruvate dehydrogenase E2 component (dihydrolipoamide acetyltransferase)/2-oxoisovalerate dehydrogenase E2 component (dihydrolipoyl transacylase)